MFTLILKKVPPSTFSSTLNDYKSVDDNNHLTPSQVFRIKPPMCINKEDVDLTLNALSDALSVYERNYK